MNTSKQLALLCITPIVFVLASCTDSTKPAGEPTDGPTAGSEPMAGATDTVLAPPPVSCSVPAPAICAGPLTVSVENVTLLFDGPPSNEGRRRMLGTATVVLQSRSSQAVRAAILDEPITLAYRNGTTMTLNNSNGATGMAFCGDDGVECINNQRSPFSTINPGDSPVRVLLKFEKYIEAAEIKTLADANTADLSMSIWTIETDPAGERRTISVGNSPVQNGTLQ